VAAVTAGGWRRGLLDWLARKPAGALASGTRVNSRYALERWLGGGGMAEVFLARAKGAEGFTRWVALKRVLPGFSADAELARLFVSEAQVSSRLQHPNLVSILDFDRDDQGQLFLIMELVDGVNLGRLLDTGALGIPLIIYLAIEILSGLRYAHDLPVRTSDGVRGIPSRRPYTGDATGGEPGWRSQASPWLRGSSAAGSRAPAGGEARRRVALASTSHARRRADPPRPREAPGRAPRRPQLRMRIRAALGTPPVRRSACRSRRPALRTRPTRGQGPVAPRPRRRTNPAAVSARSSSESEMGQKNDSIF